MRARYVLILAVLVTPFLDIGAQRLPTTRRRGPARPAELPPQPAPVARELAYRRLPYSFETYPFVSYQNASSLPGPGLTSWVSGGVGQRIDLRVAPMFSATLDATSSFLGSPVRTETVELGGRFRPDLGDGRWYPFVDARFGYMHTFQTQFQPYDVTDPFGAGAPLPGSRWSRGFGGVAGAGVEYRLSRMFSLTTAGSIMRSGLTSRPFLTEGESIRYWMTSYRYMIGLRFNPVRSVHPPIPTYPASAAPKR